MPLMFGSTSAKLPFVHTTVLANDQNAGAVNLTVTTADGSGYIVHWGDGNSSIKASGAQATYTYGDAFDGNVLISTYGAITSLVSTAGGWDFNVSALPSTLLTLDFSGANVAITGLADDLPPGLVHLDLAGTDSNIQGEFYAAPASITYFDVSGTDSTMISFITNMPDGLVYFNATNSPVEVYGDMGALPSTLTYFSIGETGSAITASSQETSMGAGIKFIDLSNTNLGSGVVDDLLIALAKIPSWLAPKVLDIGGNNAPRTSASDAAVATLEGLGVTVTVNEPVPTPGNATLTASDPVYVASGTSITIDKPAGTVEGDVLTALIYLDEQPGAGVITPPSVDWDPAADFTSALNRQRHVVAFTMVAGASEPADYTFDSDGPAAQWGGVILRGQDINASTILDVTFVGGSHALDDAIEPFTAPDITTVTDNAMVILFQAVSHDGMTAGGAPADFTLLVEQVGVQDGQILVAYMEKETAGLVSPGDWTSTFANTDGSATTIALALRAALTGEPEPIPEPASTVLMISQAAGPVELIITTDDDSTFVVDWGDGTISAETASGEMASHSYAAAYDGYAVVHTDGNITGIESATGGWEFPLCCLPSTLTYLKVAGVGVTGAITGALSDLPSGVTDFQLFNTAAAITGDLGDEPSGMVTMYLSNTNSVIGGASADMASTFVNLSLRLTDSTAAFDLSDIPATMRLLRLHDSLCTVDGSAGTMLPSAFDVVEMENMGLTSSEVDDILASFATITTWNNQQRIDIDGTNDPRTTDSDAAVTTLQGNGVTVTANGPIVVDPPDPVTRVGIRFTSILEDGQIYPDSSADDGWRDAELHPTEPYRSQCFQVLAAGDTDGIAPREGTHCMRFYWQRYWPKWGTNANNTRAELKRSGNIDFNDGDELWMGWSIFLPDESAVRNWVNNTNTNQSVIQFHDAPGSTSQLMARSGRWEWAFGPLGKQFCGTVQFGVWTDFVIHAKVSRGGDGFCKLWVNADSDADTPAYNRTGQTLRNTADTMYLKIGIYNQDFDNQAANIAYIKQYHDAYRIGNATSNFNSVKPG